MSADGFFYSLNMHLYGKLPDSMKREEFGLECINGRVYHVVEKASVPLSHPRVKKLRDGINEVLNIFPEGPVNFFVRG